MELIVEMGIDRSFGQGAVSPPSSFTYRACLTRNDEGCKSTSQCASEIVRALYIEEVPHDIIHGLYWDSDTVG